MAKRAITQVMKKIICMCMVVIVLAPILLTLYASIKTNMAVSSPLLPPAWSNITFENFKKVLSNKYLLMGFKNTGIILIISLIFNVMFGTITAFIIERFQFKGKKIVVALFFIGMLIPTFVTEIARFRIINGPVLLNNFSAFVTCNGRHY